VPIRDFQRALCDLIASPELCVRLRVEGEEALNAYDLTERERRRLEGVVRQRGMSVSCTLYRANRVTPLYSLLPRTCVLLGDRLRDEVGAFWLAESTDMQFGTEIERFAEHIRSRMAEGALRSPYIPELLDFELAVNALQVAPRERLLAELRQRPVGDAWEANPLLRVVRFAHRPRILLEELDRGRIPAVEPERGNFYLLLNGSELTLDVREIDPHYGDVLADARPGVPLQLDPSNEVAALIEAQMLVPA